MRRWPGRRRREAPGRGRRRPAGHDTGLPAARPSPSGTRDGSVLTVGAGRSAPGAGAPIDQAPDRDQTAPQPALGRQRFSGMAGPGPRCPDDLDDPGQLPRLATVAVDHGERLPVVPADAHLETGRRGPAALGRRPCTGDLQADDLADDAVLHDPVGVEQQVHQVGGAPARRAGAGGRLGRLERSRPRPATRWAGLEAAAAAPARRRRRPSVEVVDPGSAQPRAGPEGAFGCLVEQTHPCRRRADRPRPAGPASAPAHGAEAQVRP